MLEDALRIYLALTFAREYTITPVEPIAFDFSYTVAGVTISNPAINYGSLGGMVAMSYNPDEIYASLVNTEALVDAGLDVHFLFFDKHINAPVYPVGQLNFTRDGQSGFVKGDACNLSVKVHVLVKDVNEALCDHILPLVNTEMRPSKPVVYPPLMANATPLSTSRLVIAAQNIAKGLSNLINTNVEITTPASTALRIVLQTKTSLHSNLNLSFSEIDERAQMIENEINSMTQLPESIRNLLSSISHTVSALLANITLSPKPLEGRIDLDVHIPSSARVALDVAINDYRCDETGFECSFPSVDGLRILNLSIDGMADFDNISSSVNSALDDINQKISASLSKYCDNVTGRCTISLNVQDPSLSPPLFVMIFMPALAAIASIVLTGVNVWRHQQHPVLRTDGEPVSTGRIVAEDFLFTLFIVGTAWMFLASNTSTSTTVVMGSVIPVHGFGLIDTVKNLWSAGLIALSIMVMMFCGVYPYFKLCVILLYTVVLHRPSSRVLKVIDIVGKLSFLDTYVMVIMATGISVKGVVVMEILPGFYLFLAGTVFSIIAGNYGVHCWRLGTTIRCSQNTDDTLLSDVNFNPLTITKCGNIVTPLVDAQYDEFRAAKQDEEDRDSEGERCNVGRFFKRVWWAVGIPSCIAIAGLTLPSLICTTLSFEVGGLAQMILPKVRAFSLLDILSNAGVVCTITVIVTLLVAPMLNAFFFQSMMFLSSWAASDALLLACAGGLIQINQFVQFTLGGNYNYFYNVHAQLHWPLWLLFAATVLTWLLYFIYLFDVRDYLNQRSVKSKRSKGSAQIDEVPSSCQEVNFLNEPRTEVFPPVYSMQYNILV